MASTARKETTIIPKPQKPRRDGRCVLRTVVPSVWGKRRRRAVDAGTNTVVGDVIDKPTNRANHSSNPNDAHEGQRKRRQLGFQMGRARFPFDVFLSSFSTLNLNTSTFVLYTLFQFIEIPNFFSKYPCFDQLMPMLF